MVQLMIPMRVKLKPGGGGGPVHCFNREHESLISNS